MTTDALAQAIGERLLIHRSRLKLSPRDIHSRGGPTAPTVRTIEHGTMGEWEKLASYCAAIDQELPDLLSAILAPPPPLSDEARQLLRLFEEMTVEARGALLTVAREMPKTRRPG